MSASSTGTGAHRWPARWRSRTLVLSVVSGATLIAQFALQMVPLALEGVSAATDALYLGLLPLLFVQAAITTNLQHVVVPAYAHRFEERVDRYWRSAVPVSLAGAFVAALATVVTYGLDAAGWLAVEGPARDVFVQSLAVGSAAMVFNIVSGYLSTGAYLADRYVTAETASLGCSLVALAALPMLLEWRGLAGAAWAICLRWGINVLVGVALVPRPGAIGRGPNDALTMLRTGWRLFAGNALIRSDLFTDRILAALTPAGNLSMLHVVQMGVGGVNSVVNRGGSRTGASTHGDRARWRRRSRVRAHGARLVANRVEGLRCRDRGHLCRLGGGVGAAGLLSREPPGGVVVGDGDAAARAAARRHPRKHVVGGLLREAEYPHAHARVRLYVLRLDCREDRGPVRVRLPRTARGTVAALADERRHLPPSPAR